MISEYQIVRQIKRLLANKISLDDFEDWLVQSSWNMQIDSDSKAQDIVWKIELSLAEYSSEHLDSKELFAELGDLIPKLSGKTVWYVNSQEPIPVTTQSSAIYLDCSLFQPTLTLDYADTPSATASA